MYLEPYESENLIFFDTEFSSLEPNDGQLLSIGIVKLNGEELYIELQHEGDVSEWVAKHVVPSLDELKLSSAQAADKIREFLGESNPFAIAFVDNYDVIYLTKIFGAGSLPFRWMTVDFSSILFANGINPVKFLPDEKGAFAFYKKLGINLGKYRKHHALDDAKLLRDVWLKVTQPVKN